MQKRKNIIIKIAVFFIAFILSTSSSRVQASSLEEQAEYPPSRSFISIQSELNHRMQQLRYKALLDLTDVVILPRPLSFVAEVSSSLTNCAKAVVNATTVLVRGIASGLCSYFRYYVLMISGLCTQPVHTVKHEILRPLAQTFCAIGSGIYLMCTDFTQFVYKVRTLSSELSFLAAQNPEQTISLAVESILAVFHARFSFNLGRLMSIKKASTLATVVKQNTIAQGVVGPLGNVLKTSLPLSSLNLAYAKATNIFYYSQSYRCYFLVEAYTIALQKPYKRLMRNASSYLLCYTSMQHEQFWFYLLTGLGEETRRLRRLLKLRAVW